MILIFANSVIFVYNRSINFGYKGTSPVTFLADKSRGLGWGVRKFTFLQLIILFRVIVATHQRKVRSLAPGFNPQLHILRRRWACSSPNRPHSLGLDALSLSMTLVSRR